MAHHANITRTYDARGLVSLIRHTKTDGTLLELASYSYDDAGNPLTRTTNAGVTTWSYDDASQLLSEQHSSGTTDTWTYDQAGNRLTRARSTGGAPVLTSYAYDQAAQLTTLVAGTTRTTFLYDLNGNMLSENTPPTGITTYSWDALNRLASVLLPGGGRSTYTYRFDDLRATQNLGTGVQSLVWDVPGATGFGDLFEELDSSSNLIRAYFRGTDLATQRDNSGSYAFHWIDAGTAQILTDATGAAAQNYQFSAWGEQFSAPGAATTPLAWNGDWGYYQDPGIITRNWVRQRNLDVVRGRWFSVDPIGFAGGLNLYAYAENSPVPFTDPTGEFIGLVVISLVALLFLLSERPADRPDPSRPCENLGIKYLRALDELADQLQPRMLMLKTIPPLPPQVIVRQRRVRIQHNYTEGDFNLRGIPQEHGPAHAHVTGGGGAEVRIGPLGQPMFGDKPLSDVQRSVIEANRNKIRHVLNRIGRMLERHQKELKAAEEAAKLLEKAPK